MPRDGSGNYSLPSGNPVISGTVISSGWANTTMDDIAQALTESLSRYGNGGLEVPLQFGDGTVSLPSITFSSNTAYGMWFDTINSRVSITGGGVEGISVGAGGAVEINTDVTIGDVDGTEISYLNGVTSSIQDQLDGTGISITGAITPYVNTDATINKVFVSDGAGKMTTSATSAAQMGYLSDVTSNIQAQLNNKSPLITGGASTIVFSNLTSNRALQSNSSGKVAISPTTSTALSYVAGVTSSIQDQLNTLSGRISSNDSDIATLDSTKADKNNPTITDPVLSGTVIYETNTITGSVFDPSNGYQQFKIQTSNTIYTANVGLYEAMEIVIEYVSGTYDFNFTVNKIYPAKALTAGNYYHFRLWRNAEGLFMTLLGTSDPAYFPA